MNSFVKYRISALLLVLVFGLFNIGLPIVVASCPMNDDSKAPMCGSCADQREGVAEKLTSTKNTSCCQTVIAADKNNNEFMQVKYAAHESVKFVATAIVPVHLDNLLYRPSDLSEDHPLFVPIDIPIFTSSLLI